MDATAVPDPLYVKLPEIEAAGVERGPKHPNPAIDWPEIDLSLVTYNSQRWLEGFFASLVAQSYDPGKIHLYCIDHSPEGACVPLLRELAAGLGFASCIVEARPNRGFGAGHNCALALGQSDFVLVTNVDLALAPEALAVLVRRALDDPAAAGWEARQKPYEHPKAYDIVTGATAWASSACILWRRQALAAVGGYDEHFFMYGEDVDLSGRLRAAGWVLRYMPQAVAWHETYAAAGQVKDAQYFGGTLANFWLRLRFGSFGDILSGAVLQLSLLPRRRFYARGLGYALGHFGQLVKSAGYFWRTRTFSQPSSRGLSTGSMPAANMDPANKSRDDGAKLFFFQGWDYTPHRAGAFVGASRARHERLLVSIIVRTYPGRGPLLVQALASLAAQTWDNLEVIVVEDGGETARPLIEAWRAKLNLVYYPAPKARRCQAGNLGLALAQGALIGFLDDDDLLFADHVETLAEALADNPTHPAAQAEAWEVATSFTSGAWLPLRENPPQNRAAAFDRSVLWANNTMPIQSVLFRRMLAETYGGFSLELPYLEDWDLWLRYAQAGDFLSVAKTTSLYRMPVDPAIRTARMQDLAGCREMIAARRAQLGGAWAGFTPASPNWRFRLRSGLAGHPAIYRGLRRVMAKVPFLDSLSRKLMG
jgi:GT2 family glycosyltransferase